MSDQQHHSEGRELSEEALKADQFFRAGYCPADDKTAEYVENFTVNIIGRKAETSAKGIKYQACVSDYIATVKKCPSGLIAWQTDSAHFATSNYSRRIAENVRDALLRKRYLRQVQNHSKGLCRVYEATKNSDFDGLKFKKTHSSGALKVREPTRFENGKKRKGKLIPLHRYDSVIVLPLIKEMEVINKLMDEFQLEAPDGTTWNDCYRQFNNGDTTGKQWINMGGRIYGGWQSRTENERLQCTIGGEEICEVDIKACYLFIANQLSHKPMHLPDDPYQLIRFVQNNPEHRSLAKLLVSAIFSKDGPVKRFPKGRVIKDIGYKNVRDLFGLGKSVRCEDFVNDILKAFPFLKTNIEDGLSLMYRESEIVVASMITLANQNIPTYPVHDCLLCRIKDKDTVISIIQKKMMKLYGTYSTLEIGYSNGDSSLIPSSQNLNYNLHPLNLLKEEEVIDYEDDYPVLEEFYPLQEEPLRA